MKAHRVKCQQCSHGVTVVVAQPKDDGGLIGDSNGVITEVFAGALGDDEAIDKIAPIIAAQENEARKAILEEGEEFDEITPQDIRLNWAFAIQSMPIRA
jgi:hypothetical protein